MEPFSGCLRAARICLRAGATGVGLLFCASMVWAQDGAVESLGVRPCSDLTAAQTEASDSYAAFAAWLGGYLTAANAYEPQTYDLTPWQPIELATAQVAQACATNPDTSVAQVAANYVTFLRPDRLTEADTLIQLRNGQQAVFVYKSVLADVRAKFEAEGTAITDPEGSFGQSFGEAVLAFQGQAGLTQTGLLDLQTLMAVYR